MEENFMWYPTFLDIKQITGITIRIEYRLNPATNQQAITAKTDIKIKIPNILFTSIIQVA